MTIWLYSLISVAIVSLLSLIGLTTFKIEEEKLKKFLIYLVSFSIGALFADAFIHLLPEAVKQNGGFTIHTSFYILFGIILSFIIEKFIHLHHYHHHHTDKCLPHIEDLHEEHIMPFAKMSLIGDGVHNFIDGLIIGASYVAAAPIGIATTIAVILHEIPHEFGNFGILLHGGYSKKKALLFNFFTGLVAIFGTVTALLLNAYVHGLINFLIPFAAGGLIYIAGSDLIPELHKEIDIKKSIWQFIFFILGIALIASLLLVE